MTPVNGALIFVLVLSAVLAGTGIAGAVIEKLRPGVWQTTIIQPIR